MFFPDNGAPVGRGVAAAAGRLLARLLLRRRGGRPWVAGGWRPACAPPIGVSGADLTDQACLSGYAIAGRPALCRLGLLDIACVSAGVCYAVATAPPAYDTTTPIPKTPHPAASSIWLTRDGGANWTQQSIPPGVACNGDCQSGLYGYPLEWVTCLSSGLCRAGGGDLLSPPRPTRVTIPAARALPVSVARHRLVP